MVPRWFRLCSGCVLIKFELKSVSVLSEAPGRSLDTDWSTPQASVQLDVGDTARFGFS